MQQRRRKDIDPQKTIYIEGIIRKSNFHPAVSFYGKTINPLTELNRYSMHSANRYSISCFKSILESDTRKFVNNLDDSINS